MLQELYCDEDDCDCRSVYIWVVHAESGQVQAVISYGWESMEFYEKWMGGGPGAAMLEDFKGPALAMSGRQSRSAPFWLKFFKDLIEADKDYAQRLQRHYKIARAVVEKRRRKKSK